MLLEMVVAYPQESLTTVKRSACQKPANSYRTITIASYNLVV